MTLERGTLLHKRYRIVEILGQGGMGSVYRAVDENLGVDVALKENLFTTDEYSRQFRLEAVILANLRHPNLPRVSDHFVVGEQGQYLVMDYIEGEDLRQRMERIGNIGEDEAISIGAAMCDALAYLHSRRPPILHRDLKPGNVKITPDGHIFLVDFGLAKVVQGAQATTTGARAMTPGYSPPEQYGTARTDPRTDVYSLGATLYAALSGIIPEDGLARAMDNAQLTPLRKRNPKISKKLATVIEKAMSIDPAERYQNADEFQRALLASKSKTQQLTGNYMVTPPPPEEEGAVAREKPPSKPSAGGPPYPPEDNGEDKPFRPPKKKKRNGCFSPFLLILLLALALFLVWNYMPGAKQRVNGWLTDLRVATVTLTATKEMPSPVPPTKNTPSVSPIAITPTKPTTPTVTRHPSTPTVTPTPTFTLTVTSVPLFTSTPTTGPTFTPSPTPQGGGYGQFAFASDRTGIPQIYLANTDGSSGKIVLTNMPDGACQPAWSPDGAKLLFTSPCNGPDDPFENSTLYIINADGTGQSQLLTEPNGDYDPAWSPDGTRIAFTSRRNGRPSIFVLNLATKSVSLLVEPQGNFTASRSPTWSPFSNQILYVVEHFGVYEIWSMTDTGLNPEQVVFSGADRYDTDPSWSPDGTLVMFSQRRVGPSTTWLMRLVYEERGLGKAKRVDAAPTPFEDVEFSPDGLWLIFEGISDNVNRDIFLMRLDASTFIRLTIDPGADFDPAWRPIQNP